MQDLQIQPESCNNFLQMREFPDTTGELRESKKILRFSDSCNNSCDLGCVGKYIYISIYIYIYICWLVVWNMNFISPIVMLLDLLVF